MKQFQLFLVIGTLLLTTTTSAVFGERISIAKSLPPAPSSSLSKLHEHNSVLRRLLSTQRQRHVERARSFATSPISSSTTISIVRGGADFVGNDDDDDDNDAASTMAASVFKGGGGLGNNNGGKGGWFGKILKGGASSSGGDTNIKTDAAASATTNFQAPSSIIFNGEGAVGGGRMSDGIMKPPLLRPPPPPPPPLGNVDVKSVTSQGQSPPWLQQQHQQQRLTPQQQQQQHQQQQQYQQQLPGNPYYYPNNNYNNGNTNSNYNNRLHILDTNSNSNEEYQNILNELDESTIREMTYMNQIQNLSSYIDTITQETAYLSNKVDILVERLADSTSNYHHVKNQNIELSSNCTILSSMIDTLQQEMQVIIDTNIQLQEQNDEYEHVIITGLRSELRRTTDTLERLSCLVENERFEEEKSRFLDELHIKQVRERKKLNSKKRSFWGWLFGWSITTNDNDVDGSGSGGKNNQMSIAINADEISMDDEERTRAARELARTTLLHALQVERSNVDELEVALDTLRSNNTAIMDMVNSRDSIISELNERVSVFEEDKLVLKAALRQLQQEMKDEAPRTNQLVLNLEKAHERENELLNEIICLDEEYKLERDVLESRISNITSVYNTTRAELELVGLYVDQLEDRLANFAIARRELEIREVECNKLEVSTNELTTIIEEYKHRTDELLLERNETRAVLTELVTERDKTRVRIVELEGQIAAWKERVDEANNRCEEIKGQGARQLFLRIEEGKVAWEVQAQQRIQNERQLWEEERIKELDQFVTSKKDAWELQINNKWQDRFNKEMSEVEHRLMVEWTDRLQKQKAEQDSQHLEHVQRTIEHERSLWEIRKENEIHDRISLEKSAWEKEMADSNNVNEAQHVLSSSLTEEVEKAANKVYARLEERGVSFGVSNPSLVESVQALFDTTAATTNTSDDDEDDVVKDRLKRGIKNYMSDDDNSSDDYDEKSEIPSKTLSSISSSDAQQKRNIKSSTRTVPFRSIRKTLSRVTGVHGILNPSSKQLHHQHEQMNRRRQEQHQWSSSVRHDLTVETMVRKDEHNKAARSVEESVSDGVLHPPVLSSSSPNTTHNEATTSTETSKMLDNAWDNNYNVHDAGENSAPFSTWTSDDSSSEGMNNIWDEPPPLPEMD